MTGESLKLIGVRAGCRYLMDDLAKVILESHQNTKEYIELVAV